MATYAELTDQQKADLETDDKLYRGVLSSLLHLRKQSNAEHMAAWIVANVDAAVDSLDAGEAVPNATNLVGAADLTAAEWRQMRDALRALMTTAAALEPVAIKAVGINAE